MKLRFDCRNQDCPALIEYRPTGAGAERFCCPRCPREYTVQHSDRLLVRRALSACALCGGEELFIRKNFPQKTGLLIVVAAVLISLLSLQQHIGLAYGVLAAAVIVDGGIYYLVGVVTVCYRCRAEYWGLPRNPEHHWFDLATSEKYR